MGMQSMSGIRNTAVAVLLAAPSFPDWFPLWLRIALLLSAVILLIWTWMPERWRRAPMTFGAVVMIMCAVGFFGGIALHFLAPDFLITHADSGAVVPQPRGGDVNLQGNVSAGSGSQTAPGGDTNIEAGTGYKGASGGNVNMGPGNYSAGDAGPGGAGGNLNIKAGDAK